MALGIIQFCIYRHLTVCSMIVSTSLLSIVKIHRATSHTRLRARARFTSSTLIGGKGGASGPSSLKIEATVGEDVKIWMRSDMEMTWTLHVWKWMMYDGLTLILWRENSFRFS